MNDSAALSGYREMLSFGLVDALLGQEEIVVEPFDPPSGTPAVFSGASILSDGVPSLIIDAAAIT